MALHLTNTKSLYEVYVIIFEAVNVKVL